MAWRRNHERYGNNENVINGVAIMAKENGVSQ
jgi:hypothetical protein